MSRGLSYYCLNADGHIEAVLDNPEHAVKLSRASLSFMAPLVKNLSAPVLPALKEASRWVGGWVCRARGIVQSWSGVCGGLYSYGLQAAGGNR
jgi:cell division inhibitor SulA